MVFLVCTSGYSHAEWKGSFYPEKISQKKMLGYYAQRFSTVDISYTCAVGVFRRPNHETSQVMNGVGTA
jgi:hypothetical protein